MKSARKIWLFTLLSVAGITGVCLLPVVWFYVTCPVYQFDDPQPFAGPAFYNPYQDMTADAWMKCVFHLHTKSWMGLTNGENTHAEVTDAYRQLGFDVVAVSDYMRINRGRLPDMPYIPVYEHGYNVKKVHQLALGAGRVVWRDYFFWQSLHHKQHILDILKKNSLFVAVNHPSMRSSYLPDDFKYLSGYDLFEVQNGTHLSEKAWDAALSSGRRAWLIANDDAHSVNYPARLQREVTFINVPKTSTNDLLQQLAEGVAFGVHFPRQKQASRDEKLREAAAVSFPVSIQVQDDTLRVVWRQVMRQIEFIGDNGKVLKIATDSDAASYAIGPEDSYIRVKLTSPDAMVYYLNPVVRCWGEDPVIQRISHVDKRKTLQKRAAIALVFGLFAFGMIRRVI